jgi:uncharacterized protein (DUF302 family)
MEKNLTKLADRFDMVDVLRKEVSYPFDEAIERVEKACTSEGFGVLLTKDVDTIFRESLGVDYSRYTFILVCAPELAKKALDTSKDVGTIFPCSFVVYEDNNRVMVAHTSIMKIAAEIGLVPREAMAPVIEEIGLRVRRVWDKI